MNKRERENQISYKVSQSNDLITNMRVPLTMNEQKLVVMAISMIKPTDREFQWYTISSADFCKMTGLKPESFYTDFMEMAVDIERRQAEAGRIVQDKGKVFMAKWFASIEYVPRSGAVRLLFDPHLTPYLLDLKRNFTQYELWAVLRMKGKYSFRLYQILKKDAYDRHSATKQYAVDKLKDALMANTYDRWKDFRVRVIEPAIKEINDCSDVTVEYKMIKTGRRVTELSFTVTKKGRDDAYAAYMKVLDQINEDRGQIPGQTSLFDKKEEDFAEKDYSNQFTIVQDWQPVNQPAPAQLPADTDNNQ